MNRAHPIDLLPIAVGIGVVGALLLTWAMRLSYPYDLEWMEGGMLAHAWRITQGESLYIRPSPSFVPFIYPPGYPALIAAISPLTGLAPGVGRALSLLGTLGAATAVGFTVYRPSKDAVIAVLSAALFLGCYPYTGAFYDLVRPDGLLIGLLGWAIALALIPGRPARLGSALLLVCAFLVKHNAAFFGPALVLGIAVRDGRRAALEYSLAAAGPALVATAWLQLSTDGLFLSYLLAVPRSHPLIGTRLFPGAALELAQALPFTTAMAALWLLSSPHPRPNLSVGAPLLLGASLAVIAQLTVGTVGVDTHALPSFLGLSAIGAVAGHGLIRLGRLRSAPLSADWVFGIGLSATALLSATWMRAHSGGYLNVHIPFFWVASVAAGVAATRMDPRHRPLIAVVFAIQLATQGLSTPHARYRPTEADLEAGDRLVETLRRIDGPVWSPFAVWLPTYAGHEPQSHLIGIMDLDIEGGPLRSDLRAIRQAVTEQHWGAILTSDRPLPYKLKAHYRVRTRLRQPSSVLTPPSGWPVHLEAIWVPN